MSRLKTAPSRLQSVPSRFKATTATTERRTTGRALQARRLRVWSRDPHCADCRRLVEYPHGFELDHDVALVNGGEDTDENSRVRCIPCHKAKTARDLSAART